MAETETAPTDAPPETGDAPEPDKDAGKELDDLRTALKKANGDAERQRRRLKELEDRDKSELEKATERAAEAEKRIVDIEQSNMRLKVGQAKGLNPELTDRLRGDTEQDLADDADRLLAVVRPGAPQGEAGAGARQSVTANDMNDLIRRNVGL